MVTDGSLARAVEKCLSLDRVVRAILDSYDGVVPVQSWGETSLFYNPDRVLPRGAYFCTLKDHDGDNDRASRLDRPGVYRLAFGVRPSSFARLFGPPPPRPGKGGVIAGPWDFTTLDLLTPHPVYAWMGWVSVLNPTPSTFDRLQPLVGEAHSRAKSTYNRRTPR